MLFWNFQCPLCRSYSRSTCSVVDLDMVGDKSRKLACPEEAFGQNHNQILLLQPMPSFQSVKWQLHSLQLHYIHAVTAGGISTNFPQIKDQMWSSSHGNLAISPYCRNSSRPWTSCAKGIWFRLYIVRLDMHACFSSVHVQHKPRELFNSVAT